MVADVETPARRLLGLEHLSKGLFFIPKLKDMEFKISEETQLWANAYRTILKDADDIMNKLSKFYGCENVAFTGAYERKLPEEQLRGYRPLAALLEAQNRFSEELLTVIDNNMVDLHSKYI